MLTDHERKLLRILYNLTFMHRSKPTMAILETKTGYRRYAITKALEGLERERYIEWPLKQVEEIKVLEGWERGSGPVTRPEEKSTYDYRAWFN